MTLASHYRTGTSVLGPFSTACFASVVRLPVPSIVAVPASI